MKQNGVSKARRNKHSYTTGATKYTNVACQVFVYSTENYKWKMTKFLNHEGKKYFILRLKFCTSVNFQSYKTIKRIQVYLLIHALVSLVTSMMVLK